MRQGLTLISARVLPFKKRPRPRVTPLQKKIVTLEQRQPHAVELVERLIDDLLADAKNDNGGRYA